MRHGVLLLSFAAGLVACSDADPIRPPEEEPAPEPRPAKIEEMRVVKVRGDQEAQVPPPEIAPGSVRVLRATVGADGWTDEPLVARIEVVQPGGFQTLQADGDSVYVPKGTLVHWHLSDGCGRLFASTTATDDTATTVNRWAPGTKAGTCTATAGRLVGTEIVTDATWELEILPGPPVSVSLDGLPLYQGQFRSGDTIDIRDMVLYGRDAYGNETPRDSIIAWPDDAVGWAWTPYMCRPDCPALPDKPTNYGWRTVVPPLTDASRDANGLHHFRFSVWFPVPNTPGRLIVLVLPDPEPPEDPPN